MRQDRLLEIVGRIYQNPACWDQTKWHCGTAHCVAGHAQIDSGQSPIEWFAQTDGMKYLDLTRRESLYLFRPSRTLEELIQVAISGVIPI